MLKDYIENNSVDEFNIYKITALSPNMPSDEGAALYLRDGSFVNGKQTFEFMFRITNLSKTEFLGKKLIFILTQNGFYLKRNRDFQFENTIFKALVNGDFLNPGIYYRLNLS